ncbi:MAG: NAD(P)H-dependent oxidoreductase subunit E [Candidatus Aminicenantales bacterium]
MEKILKEFGPDQKELIHILHRVQEAYGYISAEAIAAISRYLKISENEIYGVLTFYKAFSLEPRGKHVLTVCMGTACHVRGAPRLVDDACRELGIQVGQTTPDGNITLETVNCLGCCAIGPVVVVDGTYHSYVKRIDPILKALSESGTSDAKNQPS